MNEETGEVAGAVVMTNNCGDGQVLAELLGQVSGELQQVMGDGGYDDRQCYEAIRERASRSVIPPQRERASGVMGTEWASATRGMKICATCAPMGGRSVKRDYEYHRRSLAEVAVFRLKQIFESSASARGFEGRPTAGVMRAALNRMTHEGMPDSHKVAA